MNRRTLALALGASVFTLAPLAAADLLPPRPAAPTSISCGSHVTQAQHDSVLVVYNHNRSRLVFRKFEGLLTPWEVQHSQRCVHVPFTRLR